MLQAAEHYHWIAERAPQRALEHRESRRTMRDQRKHLPEPTTNTATVASSKNLNVVDDYEREERQLSGSASFQSALAQQLQYNCYGQTKKWSFILQVLYLKLWNCDGLEYFF